MIDFSNMLGKPLRHCFVPADQASITFVFEDGMRRSFGVGAGNVLELTAPAQTEGCTLAGSEIGKSSRFDGAYAWLLSTTDREPIVLIFKSLDGVLTELPE